MASMQLPNSRCWRSTVFLAWIYSVGVVISSLASLLSNWLLTVVSISMPSTPASVLTTVTDVALSTYRKMYSDPSIAKDDIFFYTYGLLHSPEYRDSFTADLKKSLPRIPMVQDFRGFAAAGRKLSELHLNYETANPYPGIVEDVRGASSATPPTELYRVIKMKIPKVRGSLTGPRLFTTCV